MKPKQTTREKFITEFLTNINAQELNYDVLSSGPINAEIAFVGEGPGETEVRKGEPWVGNAGNLLWNATRGFGLHRANIYATNVVKRQISLSRKGNEKHVVHREELDKWIGLLQWELSRLPNVRTIFALGGYALEALTGLKGITDYRGSVLEHKLPNGKLGKIIIANNPAYALRNLKMEPIFLMDCDKLNRVVSNTFKPHVIEEIINPSYKDARAFIKELSKQKLPISLDIEHINNETVCYGLANDSRRAMCINFRDHVRNRFTPAEEANILLDLQALCESHRIIAQNGAHEIYWSRLRDWLHIPIWFDTLLAHHVLYPQLPHNLGFLTAQYTTHPFYKDEGTEWKESGDIDKFWAYNCKDAAITYRVYERLDTDLKKQGLDKFFFDHVMRAQQHLAASTVHGIAIDLSIKERITELVEDDVAKTLAEFHKQVRHLTKEKDYFPNPGSWQQMQVLYFDKLKLKGKGKSTDEDNRNLMMKDPGTSGEAKELLTTVGKYQEENKFLGTYAKSEASPDGRFRTDYKQYGVANAPGRLSSAALINGEGGNIQNQPMRARAMFVSDPDTVFVYFDLKQAEAQVVAYRANIPKWKAQFEQARKDGKYDCHRALASDMFKVEYDDVPTVDWLDDKGRTEKDPLCNHSMLRPTIRYKSKRCRHGLNYRMERFRLSQETGLPYHEAVRLFAIYHSVTPELRKWWEQEERTFKDTHELYNALGRRLKVIQRVDEDVMKSIVAFYPQSTIGDKVTQVWYQCEDDDKWPVQARIGIDVHDNLVGITPLKYAKSCLAIMKKYAEEPIWIQDAWKRKSEPLSIGADLKMSYPTRADVDDKGKLTFVEDKKGLHRWSHMKEVVL